MYLIKINTSGIYNNVKTGYRFCIFKKSAVEMVEGFLKLDCDIEVFKTFRLHGDCFGFKPLRIYNIKVDI